MVENGSGFEAGSAADDGAGGEVCIANIGGGQRSRRMAFGVVMGVAALTLAVALLLAGAPRLTRLGAVPLVWMAAVGILQFRGRT